MVTGIRFLIIFIYGAVLMGMSGCATLTKGNSQSITIDTKPAGAECTLSRGGTTISIVNPTPGTVNVDKAMADISVICKKADYHDGVGTLSSKFQGMTFGNILFGGLVGLAIDAGSGAINRYDPMLSLLLVPKEFNSAVERDVFFDGMKAQCLSEHSKALAELSSTCEGDPEKKEICQSEIKATEARKEARLIEITKMRHFAKVK